MKKNNSKPNPINLLNKGPIKLNSNNLFNVGGKKAGEEPDEKQDCDVEEHFINKFATLIHKYALGCNFILE